MTCEEVDKCYNCKTGYFTRYVLLNEPLSKFGRKRDSTYRFKKKLNIEIWQL